MEKLLTFDFVIPNLKTQMQIASVISMYDALIENNSRRIEILEELIRIVHAEQFTRLQVPGLDAASSKLPPGWRRTELREVVSEIRKSVEPSTLHHSNPYVGLEHLPRRSIALSEWGAAGDVISTKLAFLKGDILFGKIRPYFHKVVFAPIDGVCSSDTIVIRPKKDEWFSLILCYTSSDDFVSHATRTSNGTKMPRANWNVLTKYPVLIPPEPLLEQFNRFVGDIVSEIATLSTTNRNLRKTRDLILPKLVTGDVEVAETLLTDAPLCQIEALV